MKPTRLIVPTVYVDDEVADLQCVDDPPAQSEIETQPIPQSPPPD
jgi:hypothetical protein